MLFSAVHPHFYRRNNEFPVYGLPQHRIPDPKICKKDTLPPSLSARPLFFIPKPLITFRELKEGGCVEPTTNSIPPAFSSLS